MSERNLETAVAIGARPAGGFVDAARLREAADWLAVAVVASLPWSTSATSILIALWLVAVVPTLDLASVRREAMTPAGGLPLLLWAVGALGMLWADASWSDRLDGLGSFHKLLVIPLLLAQFRRSERAKWVFAAFLGSALVLLIVSWGLTLIPGLTWRGRGVAGVPVKDYILQSGIFAICAFGLCAWAAELWRTHAMRAVGLVLLAVAFAANVAYVAAARTTLVVMATLAVLLGFRLLGVRGLLIACLAGGALAGAAWMSSPHLRERVLPIAQEIRDFHSNVNTSVGLRLEFWRKSIGFVAEAPLIGRGTGSIKKLFRDDATADTSPYAISANPHNQILTVAIQLGLIGTLVLMAMWVAHLALFRGGTLVAWFGLMIVTANVVSSVFNSHLFDFTQGWLYVFGVGVAGGAVLGLQQGAAATVGGRSGREHT
jgi:O-antigen ligase